MGRAFLASVFRSTSFVDCFSTMADLDNLSADMDAANLYTEEIVTEDVLKMQALAKEIREGADKMGDYLGWPRPCRR